MANRPEDIASTSHAQHAEMQQLVGRHEQALNARDELQGKNDELTVALTAANEQVDSLTKANDELTGQLADEKAAHEKTQAALTAALATPAQ